MFSHPAFGECDCRRISRAGLRDRSGVLYIADPQSFGNRKLAGFSGQYGWGVSCGLSLSAYRKAFCRLCGCGILCYPVATMLMGKEAAVFAYVVPFLLSTGCGTVMAAILFGVMERSGVIHVLQNIVHGKG